MGAAGGQWALPVCLSGPLQAPANSGGHDCFPAWSGCGEAGRACLVCAAVPAPVPQSVRAADEATPGPQLVHAVLSVTLTTPGQMCGLSCLPSLKPPGAALCCLAPLCKFQGEWFLVFLFVFPPPTLSSPLLSKALLSVMALGWCSGEGSRGSDMVSAKSGTRCASCCSLLAGVRWASLGPVRSVVLAWHPGSET